MSLIAAGFVPHSPFLIPELNKQFKKVHPLITVLNDINHDFYQQKIDTLILITTHGLETAETFVLNHAEKITGDLADFGLPNYKYTFNHDLPLAYQLKEKTETTLPLKLSPDSKLDYGSLIPLSYCAKNLANLKVIVIYASNLSFADHLKFGQAIREIVESSNKRVAVLAGGDLAKIVDKKKTNQESAKYFDQAIISAIEANSLTDLLNISLEISQPANQCALNPLIILTGLLDQLKYQSQNQTYLNFSGVGLLATKFHLN